MIKKYQPNWHLFVSLFISTTSIVSLILLSLEKYKASHAVVLGLLFALPFYFFTKQNLTSDSLKTGRIKLFCIFLLAIVMRVGIYPHYMGGQDQGLYVLMSKTIDRSGAIDFEDRLRKSLTEDQKELYDRYKLSSISYSNQKLSRTTIEFYPLLPIWMSISRFLFGEGYHTLILLVFGILGIWNAMKLGSMLFPNVRNAEAWIGFFFAINPGLVFLSKFPLTEGLAFYFTSGTIIYLLRFIYSKHCGLNSFGLIFSSLLLLNAFFYLRMSFLVLLPILGMSLVYSLRRMDYKKKVWLRLYPVAFLILLGISFWFYSSFQNKLFSEMYEGAFKPLLTNPSVIAALAIVTVAFLACCCFVRAVTLETLIDRSLLVLHSATPYLIPLFLLISIPNAIQFYNSGLFPPFGFKTETATFASVKYLLVYKYFLFVSPFGFVLLLFLPKYRKLISIESIPLILFLFSTFIMLSYFAPRIPYLYYYGRYLLSELVPYSLILLGSTVAYIFSSPQFKIAKGISVCSGLYFLIFSGAQVRLMEGDDGNFIQFAKEFIKDEDVVIVDSKSVSRIAIEPLRYYLDKQIFVIASDKVSFSEREKLITSLVNSEKKVWQMLNGDDSEQSQLKLKNYAISNGEHIWDQGVGNRFEFSTFLLPFRQTSHEHPFSLIQINKEYLNKRYLIDDHGVIDFSKIGNSSFYILDGWSSQENNYRWTVDSRSLLKLKLNKSYANSKYLSLRFSGEAFNTRQKVLVKINEKPLFNEDVFNDFSFTIKIKNSFPLEQGELLIEISTPDSISPRDLGISSDSRRIGINIRKISINSLN